MQITVPDIKASQASECSELLDPNGASSGFTFRALLFSEPPRALQASERSELLDPVPGAVLDIFALPRPPPAGALVYRGCRPGPTRVFHT